jgi:hypothetical protein
MGPQRVLLKYHPDASLMGWNGKDVLAVSEDRS